MIVLEFFCFQEKNVKDIVLKAMGQAISKTVAISEILKVCALFFLVYIIELGFSDICK